MKRYAVSKLLEWKNKQNRKPLIIQGARQVGKTWLAREFGREHFSKVAYIRFDNNPQIHALFQSDYDISRIVLGLQIEVGFPITPEDTLIIFDEIQECPQAITSLKYFCENARQYAIIAAGSLLGLSATTSTGFPVGKVDFINLYPMTYCEFLEATQNVQLAELLQSRDWAMITTFKNRYIELLRQYYYVGGMPEVVASFVADRDFKKVREIQENLLISYRNDFSKHAPISTVPRIQMVWDSVPTQLARENKKFIYSAVKDSYRAKDLEIALTWLMQAGLIYNVNVVSKVAFPLDAYRENAFKTFFLDVGLLAAKSGLSAQTLLGGNAIFQEFKGALAEQYVQQELRASSDVVPYYWASANLEIDFLFQTETSVVPIEVKAEENLRSKSLKSFCQKNHTNRAVRASMADYLQQSVPLQNQSTVEGGYMLVNVPLYAISQLTAVLQEV